LPQLAPKTEVAAAAAADTAKTASFWRAPWMKTAGTTVFRTTELVSAAVLGAFFVGDVYNTGSDVVIWFDTTEQIREQRMRLAVAEKSLMIAEQNLDTAAKST